MDIDLAVPFPAELMRRLAELDGRDAATAGKFVARLIVVLDHHVAESLRAGGTLRQAGLTATADALEAEPA